MEKCEAQGRADFEAQVEEESRIKPALEAAVLTPFIGWLNTRRWTPGSQDAYNLAVEYALSLRRKSMTLIEAHQMFLEGGTNAAALLEIARTYFDERDYSVTGRAAWDQAELIVHAIAQEHVDTARAALRLWRTSPGASGRITSRDPADERRISVTDAAEATGVSRRTVNYAIEGGRLNAERNANGNYEITMAEFRRWKATLRAPNGSKRSLPLD